MAYGKLLFGADSPTGVTLPVEGDVNATYRFVDSSAFAVEDRTLKQELPGAENV